MPHRVKVGPLDIVSLLDVQAQFPATMMYPSVTTEQWAPYAEIYPWIHEGEGLALSISCYAILGGGRTIVVDTGLGNVWPDRPAQLLDSLREAGIDTAAVDTVIHTHLHGDQVGWNMVGGKQTFANARHVVQQADWDHFSAQKDDAAFAAQVKPLHDAGKFELVNGETQFTPEITLLPTPGHTPGHQSLLVSSGADRVFIAGDLSHHPAQAQECDWECFFDNDKPMASATRRRIMEMLERDAITGAFCHFTHPGFGMVVQDNGRRVFRAL